jgi:hypothetical protein
MSGGATQGPPDGPFDTEALVRLDPLFPSLLAYWKEKRGSRPMPRRADIDPIELREHLGSLLLTELAEPLADSRYRLVGTNIVEASGRDSTNRTIGEIYSEPTRSGLIRIYSILIARAAPHLGWGRWQVGMDFLAVGTLFLPLSDDGRTVNMVLAKMKFARAPRGLDQEAMYFGPVDPSLI